MMKKSVFSSLARPSVRTLTAYEAREIPCKVKLDANESPYAPALTAGFPDKKTLASLNRYPDPEAKELKKAISRETGVDTGSLLLGNGSDEIISYLIAAFGGPVLFPVPTFSMYGIIARSLGEKPVAVALDDEFDLDADAMLAAIRKENPKLVFLSSPNNPTGNCFSADRMLRIIEASKGIVVVDEAYGAYSSDKGFLPLMADYERLAILRTLSKIGFAALRVGFLIGRPGLIAEVNKVRLPYNLNTLSQMIAAEGLRNRKTLNSHIREIVKERARLMKAMANMDGVEPCPSEANFILFRVPDANAVFAGLLRQGVLIKNLDPAIPNAMRVTIGTGSENTVFLKALARAVKT